MTRASNDQVIGGRLINGYDYYNGAWVKDGKYQDCGHEKQDGYCPFDCYGNKHAGMQTGAKGADFFAGHPGVVR